MLELHVKPVGEWQANCYLLIEGETGQGILIDPGDEAEALLDWIGSTGVLQILITHGHGDHVGALEHVREALGAPVGVHPADVQAFDLKADFDLLPGTAIKLGEATLHVVPTPGHTPGSVALRLVEAGHFRRAIVGDAIFPGGPGHTETPDELRTSLDALARMVFTWPDAVTLYPGHGDPTSVGAERAAFQAFCAKPLPPDLCGDVTWR